MRTIRTLSLVALMTIAARGDDWFHQGRDDGRTRLPSEAVDAPALLLSAATGSASIASPVAADGVVVTAGIGGTVRAYRESDFAPLWSAALESTVVGTPLIDHGRVYVPFTNGVLKILRLADGSVLGSVATNGADHSSPILSGGRLFLASGFPRNALLGITAPGGVVDWEAALDQVTTGSPSIGGGKIVVGTNNGTLTAFSLATSQPVWSVSLGGSIGPSSPLILGNSVFVVADGVLSKVDLNSGTLQGVLALADGTGDPADTLGVRTAVSSLTQVGPSLMGVIRFDYSLDHPDLPFYPSGDGYVDGWKMREFAFAVDSGTLTLQWQTQLGETPEVDGNAIPLYGVVPAPVSIGTDVAFVTSIQSTPAAPEGDLSLLDPATGAVTATFPLDAPCQASPFVANARLIVLSRAGTLTAYQGTHAPPAAATNLNPDVVNLLVSPADLTWTSSGAGLTTVVRMARDGDLWMDWDFETVVVGGATTPCPVLADGYRYTWGVRVQDATGAWSPWTMASFVQGPPPLPPGPLTATPDLKKVHLSWTSSPTPGIVGYRLAYGVSGGPLSTIVELGVGTSTTVSGLLGGTTYAFELRAVDYPGLVSTPVAATATTLSTITIGGIPFATLADAFAAATAGDVVLLGADTFPVPAPLVLPAGVEVRGLNGLDTRLEATGLFVVIDAMQGSSVRLLSLSGGSIGVRALATDVTVANTVIRDMSDAGISVVAGTTNAINNTIVNNANFGITSAGVAVARNNIVQNNGVGLSGAVTSSYNDVSDGYAACAPGVGDRSTPVAFLNPGTGDFREQASQASLDGGAPTAAFDLEPALNGGRINMGAFGNTALAATSPAPPGSTSSGACGLVGLEVLLLVFLRRRR